MIDIREFVIELIQDGVEWDKSSHKHWIGSEILTSKKMRIRCSNKYGREYDLLTNGEQRKIRDNIFDKIRYGIDYED